MRYTILLIALAFVACKKKDPEPAPAPKPITEAMTSFRVVAVHGSQVSIDMDLSTGKTDTVFFNHGPQDVTFKFLGKQNKIHVKAASGNRMRGDTAMIRVYIDSGHIKTVVKDTVEISQMVTIW